MVIEFEDILKTVGDYGRFQKILACVILIPTSAAIAQFYLGVVFLSSTPDHWCYVPEVASSNLTTDQKMSLVRPKADPSCLVYDVDYAGILSSGNLSISESANLKKCADGWQYDRSDYDATAVTRWNMVCDDKHFSSLVMSMVFAGDVVGTPLFGHLSDRFGRKPVFFILSALAGLTEIGSTLSPNFVLFFLLRAVNGSLITALYINSYVMLLELVGTGKRASVNGLATCAWTVGLCVLPLVAWLTRNWVYLSAFCSSFAFAFLFYWKLFPESPRRLIAEGEYDKALKILSKISKWNGNKMDDTNQLKQQIEKLGERLKKEKEGDVKHSPFDIFIFAELRKRFLLVTLCWICAACSYYGLVFNLRNLSGNQFLNFFLMAVLEFPSHAVTWFCMERFGRRKSSIAAFSVTAISCILPVFFTNEASLVSMVASFAGKMGSSAAYMILYQQCPELYPTNLRNFGMSCSATIAVSASLCVPYVADLAFYNKNLPFLTFSVLSFLAAVCAAFLPETLDKALPQTIADIEETEDDDKLFSCFRKGGGSDVVMNGYSKKTSFCDPAIAKIAFDTGLSKNNKKEDDKPLVASIYTITE